MPAKGKVVSERMMMIDWLIIVLKNVCLSTPIRSRHGPMNHQPFIQSILLFCAMFCTIGAIGREIGHGEEESKHQQLDQHCTAA